MSKMRIQQYMDKHKLTPLFEELMNKVLHDQPDDPLVYLIRSLYKKAALPVPKELKPGTLRRSSPERIGRRSKSPDKTATQAWAVASGPDLVDRSYDKPWLSKSKKSKTKDEDRAESPTRKEKNKSKQQGVPSKSPGRENTAPFAISSFFLKTPREITMANSKLKPAAQLGESTLDDLLQISPKPLSPRRKQKQGWDSDNKVTATTFDDLFEEDGHRQEKAVRHRREESGTDIKKAWAKNVGLDDGEDVNFRSRGYRGPKHAYNDDDDPLAGEIMLAKEEKKKNKKDKKDKKDKSSSKHKGAKEDAKRHRKELEKALTESSSASANTSRDSGFYGNKSDAEDDAIELLEDPEDLRREGVTNISKSGYKLSRNLRHRQEEANVKLNINLIASNLASQSDFGNPYEDYYESDLERPPTGMSYQSNRYSEFSPELSEDEEFESVSQVVGPRKPVWSAPDSDGESRKPDLSQTLPERSKKHKHAAFSATMPVSFEDPGRPPFQKSVDTDMFLQGSRGRSHGTTEKDSPPSPAPIRDSTRSLRSVGDDGGWNIPDDPEGSLFTEVSGATTSARTPKGPPKAY